jgi:hypothetical protein
MIFRRTNTPQQQTQPALRTLQSYAATVEQILTTLNVDPAGARLNTAEGYGWSFRRGSAIIEVYVTEQNARGYFQVLSPILHLPTTGLLPLYRRLLELNLQLTNASLGVHNDVVFVFNERILEGLDAVEADFIIQMVASYADDLDNQLINEFGGRLFGQSS